MRKVLYFLRQVGVDPTRTIKACRNLPRYLVGLFRFVIRNHGLKGLRISPVLNDFRDAAGSADGHYFWQDLICAKWIFEENPSNHLDVGSRIDGFIAHLLTFRRVTLLDIRPLAVSIPNLECVIGNAQNTMSEYKGQFESVSSLHSIEHFGLGRCSDPIDVQGHLKGLRSISECVQASGTLYVSFPIGEASIEFNEQRVISPTWPQENLKDFSLIEFVLIPWRGEPIYGINPEQVDKSKHGQAGLYRFVKHQDNQNV